MCVVEGGRVGGRLNDSGQGSWGLRFSRAALCLPAPTPTHPLPHLLSSRPLPHNQMVTALPDIRKETLQPGDEFLVLACDGIWDVLTNQEVRQGGGCWGA